MDNFNMKQWLQENKVGPYSKLKEEKFYAPSYVAQKYGSKAKEIEDNIEDEEDNNPNIWDLYTSLETEKETDEFVKGFMNEGSSNTQKGFLKKLDNIHLTVDGQKYELTIEADYEYTTTSDTDPRPHPDDPTTYTGYDVDVTSVSPKIIELYKLKDGEDVKVTDPEEIREVEAALIVNREVMDDIKEFIAGSDEVLSNLGEEPDYYEPDLDETVGFVMKTKKSDPEQKF